MIRLGFIPKRNQYGTPNGSAGAIIAAADELKKLGVEIVIDAEAGVDLLCVHKVHLDAKNPNGGTRQHLLGGPIPLICDGDRDSPRVEPIIRKWANAGYLCGILKPCLYRPRWIYTEGTPFDFRLLELGPGYGCFPRLDELKANEPDWDAERPIDVHFAGWMDYPENQPHIRMHREQCADAVESLAEHGYNVRVIRGRQLSTPDYWAELRQSKICVSPYGWAEPCHRDVEGILCGCVVVKPRTKHIATFPDIYNSRAFLECNEDFSYMEDCLEDIRYGLNPKVAREMVIEFSTAEKVAIHMRDVIARCIERVENG